jgi:hypothetical protein
VIAGEYDVSLMFACGTSGAASRAIPRKIEIRCYTTLAAATHLDSNIMLTTKLAGVQRSVMLRVCASVPVRMNDYVRARVLLCLSLGTGLWCMCAFVVSDRSSGSTWLRRFFGVNGSASIRAAELESKPGYANGAPLEERGRALSQPKGPFPFTPQHADKVV